MARPRKPDDQITLDGMRKRRQRERIKLGMLPTYRQRLGAAMKNPDFERRLMALLNEWEREQGRSE